MKRLGNGEGYISVYFGLPICINVYEFVRVRVYSYLCFFRLVESFQSGMQVEDIEIGGETLYGLATLERLVAPWKLVALHPEETAEGQFILGEANPIEADSKYIQWLEGVKESKASNAASVPHQGEKGIWFLQRERHRACQNQHRNSKIHKYISIQTYVRRDV